MRIQALELSVDLLRVLLWQYADAPRLQSLVQSKQAWYDAAQEGFWSNWITDVFDLTTANDFGLAVWGIILGVPLVVAPPADPDDKPIWGFGVYRENFNNGNFTAVGSGAGLTTEQKRLVLRLRYFQLVTRGAVPEVNAFLADVFGPGVAYVVDGPMACTYVFATPPSSAVELVLSEYDLLPRPAGVLSRYVIQGESDGWGFGRYHETFTNGNFYVEA